MNTFREHRELDLINCVSILEIFIFAAKEFSEYLQ
jgi:hypothetical protein